MSEPLLGMIQMFAISYAPRGWSYCNGAILPISQNEALFATMGCSFGGDCRSTFGLPNLTGRSPIGDDTGGNAVAAARVPRGQLDGSAVHTLSVSELPSHNHAAVFTPSYAGGGGSSEGVEVYATTDQGDNATPSDGAFLAQTKPPTGGQDRPEQIYKTSTPTPGSLVSLGGVNGGGGGGGITGGTVTIGDTGNNDSFGLYHPSTAVSFCIAMDGLFPPRP